MKNKFLILVFFIILVALFYQFVYSPFVNKGKSTKKTSTTITTSSSGCNLEEYVPAKNCLRIDPNFSKKKILRIEEKLFKPFGDKWLLKASTMINTYQGTITKIEIADKNPQSQITKDIKKGKLFTDTIARIYIESGKMSDFFVIIKSVEITNKNGQKITLNEFKNGDSVSVIIETTQTTNSVKVRQQLVKH